LRESIRRRRLMYVRHFIPGVDVAWSDFFRTSDRGEVERACRAAGIELEWRGADGLCTRQVCDGIATHPHTGEPVFFNQIQLHHPSCLDPAVRRALVSVCGADALPRDVRFGDGGP